MFPKNSLVLILVLVFLPACCSYGNSNSKRLEGIYYPLTVTSDINDDIEIAYHEKGTDRDRNFLEITTECFEYEQQVVTKNIRANAFSGVVVNAFVENGGQLGIRVTYNGISQPYLAAGNLNIMVRASDFL